jgi:hypothetical protein
MMMANVMDSGRTQPTSFLLLKSQFGPVLLHAIPERHPEFGLFGRRHALPSLLDVGQGRVRDGVSGGSGAVDHDGGGSGDGSDSAQHLGGRCSHHLGDSCERIKERDNRRSRDDELDGRSCFSLNASAKLRVVVM